ncbi:LysR family transcriptional regulator [Rhizobium rhizogenes]|uniref:LysR family transcriptional regulator n=1 Tax=Rhizobium rhizogenes TaxID=359 RepID=UPI0022BD5A45|nr:LysR family transcriptional regulator [Rhizobium rhizogenes]MCZ7451432.1 LysR family transcriptional regulator [Rhizobium rhizogenes]
MRNLTRLKSLQALEASARHGSFVGAATELDVTPPAVGQLVRSLEDWVGYPLFAEHGQGVNVWPRLTKPGRLWMTLRKALISWNPAFESFAAEKLVR